MFQGLVEFEASLGNRLLEEELAVPYPQFCPRINGTSKIDEDLIDPGRPRLVVCIIGIEWSVLGLLFPLVSHARIESGARDKVQFEELHLGLSDQGLHGADFFGAGTSSIALQSLNDVILLSNQGLTELSLEE